MRIVPTCKLAIKVQGVKANQNTIKFPKIAENIKSFWVLQKIFVLFAFSKV